MRIDPGQATLTYAGARIALYCVDRDGTVTVCKGGRRALGEKRQETYQSQTLPAQGQHQGSQPQQAEGGRSRFRNGSRHYVLHFDVPVFRVEIVLALIVCGVPFHDAGCLGQRSAVFSGEVSQGNGTAVKAGGGNQRAGNKLEFSSSQIRGCGGQRTGNGEVRSSPYFLVDVHDASNTEDKPCAIAARS